MAKIQLLPAILALNVLVVVGLLLLTLIFGRVYCSVICPLGIMQDYISLTSYISTLLVLCLLMGIMFEIPIVCWLLARFGILKVDFMKRYRRHAIVAICIVAAIITPTADAFTLGVVALPIYLLYEFSIGIVKRTNVA